MDVTEPAPPVAHGTHAPRFDPDERSCVDAHGPWLAIRNPAAGNGRARDAWPAFERALRRAGVAFDVVATDAPGDATRIAERAAAAGVERLLVAGGDGTAHEAINGLMRSREHSAAPRRVPLVVPVPIGTGNDWARWLGLPRDPGSFATVVARHHEPGWHDVGRLRFPDDAGKTSWFMNVAGAGFDAHVLAAMGERAVSRFGYLTHALRTLQRFRSPAFRIEPQAHAAIEGRFLLAFVAISRYTGYRMDVAPMAVADDGLFDVLTIDEVGLLRALPKIVKLYRGTLVGDPLVRYLRTRALRVTSEPPAPVEADGQLVGTTPVTFDVEERALRVLRGLRARAG